MHGREKKKKKKLCHQEQEATQVSGCLFHVLKTLINSTDILKGTHKILFKSYIEKHISNRHKILKL